MSLLQNNKIMFAEVNIPAPSMFNGDTSLILQSQVIPPSISNPEDTTEISTTNLTSEDLTRHDVVKELVSDDNNQPEEPSNKRVKIG